MHLLVDGVTLGSPGQKKLQEEILRSFLKISPDHLFVTVFAAPDRVDLLKDSLLKDLPSEKQDRVEVIAIKTPRGWISKLYWIFIELPNRIRSLKASGEVVLFAQSGLFSGASRENAKVICTINNMLPFSDQQLKDYSLMSRLKFLVLKWVYVSRVRAADGLLLHSTFALNTLEKFAGTLSAKSKVVLTGIPKDIEYPSLTSSLDARFKYEEGFFFYLSSMFRYKNHLNLIRGYEKTLKALGDKAPKLYLAGINFDKVYTKTVLDYIHQQKLDKNVFYFEDLDRAALVYLMRNAVCNFFASICETNSVIQSEILGAGGVLASSNLPPMPEIGGDASLYFDPFDPESISKTMIQIATDHSLQSSLRERAKKRVEALSWDACGTALKQQLYDNLSQTARMFSEARGAP